MAQLYLSAFAVITILIVSQGVAAKRGCSAFGHSCFGGHGKRSSDPNNIDVPNADMMEVRRQLGQEETPPHPGYPRSAINGILPSGDNIIPIRDGGVYDHEDMREEMMKLRLRSLIKHWMENYKRSQMNNDDGYFLENN